MSGHSKWANIKHKKAKTDAAKGVSFAKFSREIIIAAKIGGGDINGNFRLRTAVEKAKAGVSYICISQAWLLEFRFNQAVFAVFPFVYDADRIGLGVEEYEEVVAYEVHLQNSFFDVHRAGGKFLRCKTKCMVRFIW